MRRQLLILDNYDSFTYNLAQAFGALGSDVQVVRSDEVVVDAVSAQPPAALVISPGPGIPQEAGESMRLIRALGGRVPILGVCLGHQAIGAALGARVVRAPAVVHGKTSSIYHDASGLFEGVPVPFSATRYHSLVIDEASMPGELAITARSDDGLLMAIAHRTQATFGVQFHPESVMTKHGPHVLSNFLKMASL